MEIKHRVISLRRRREWLRIGWWFQRFVINSSCPGPGVDLSQAGSHEMYYELVLMPTFTYQFNACGKLPTMKLDYCGSTSNLCAAFGAHLPTWVTAEFEVFVNYINTSCHLLFRTVVGTVQNSSMSDFNAKCNRCTNKDHIGLAFVNKNRVTLYILGPFLAGRYYLYLAGNYFTGHTGDLTFCVTTSTKIQEL